MNRKPLVVGTAPAFVGEMPAGDTLPPSVGGLGADASGWASGKVPVFDGTKFTPGDAGGGSLPAGETDQILVMGASGPEWGGSFPLDGGWVPPLEFVGMYQEGNYYTTSQAVFAMANGYGTPVATYLTPINNGNPSYPYFGSNVRRQWDTNPPEPYHEWQELAWPVSSPRFALGQSTSAGDNATAVGQFTNAGYGATAVGQFTNAGDNATAVGQSASAGYGATAVGQFTNAGDNATAVGQSANAGYGATAVGQFTNAGDNATAVGQSASAGYGATAVGQSANAGENATAVGQFTNAGDNATAVGQFTNAGENATAVGVQATATDLSIAIGALSSSPGIGSTAIGLAAFAQHERAAVLGAVDGGLNYQPSTTADRRMTVDYQEIEVINQGEGGQTAVILVDELGGQWRITVNSSGVISASAV